MSLLRHRGLLLTSGAAGSTFDASLKGASMVLSNGNMDLEKAGSGYETCYTTFGRNAGRFAFEVQILTLTSNGSFVIGIADKTSPSLVLPSYIGNISGPVETLGTNDFSGGRYYRRMTIGNISGSGAFPFAAGDVITVDVDMNANTCRFYKNGVSQLTVSITAGKTYFPALSVQTGGRGRYRPKGLAYLPSGSAEWG